MDYRVPLLELIVRNIARYPQSATSTLIRYQPTVRYLVPCLIGVNVLLCAIWCTWNDVVF
jgi:hypothetical protein